jgi:hypothetical protein
MITALIVIFAIPVVPIAIGLAFAHARGAHHCPEYDRIP